MSRDRHVTDDELQRELRDLLTLAVVGDHVRWVLTGADASELADWLGDAIVEWRAWADKWRSSWWRPASRRTDGCARWQRTSR